MNEVITSAGGPSTSEEIASESGQVCDRCRLKKIKCSGYVPCERCSVAGAECVVSTQLRRKAKARGFSASEAVVRKRLEDEIAELRNRLQAETQARKRLQDQLDRNPSGSARKRRRTQDHSTSTPSGSKPTILDRDAYVVKHMGRLARDDADVGRFAGSTTGVHFVLSVHDILRTKLAPLEPFPELCYKSYLLQPRRAASPLCHAGTDMILITVQDARNALSMSLEDVEQRLRIFQVYWAGFCPAILQDQTMQRARRLLYDLPGTALLQAENYVTLQTILLTDLINNRSEAEVNLANLSEPYSDDLKLQLVCQIHCLISKRVEIWNLQALVLFSLYVQKSGKQQWMVPLSGVMVQMAQSLGLHRHARRFRFTVEEAEWRKRLWWSVYAFDKLTAVIHGLPQLIHDADVDNDLPVDCILQDTASTQLSHPLPGEPTPVSMFCHYVQLTRILSRMLAQLYTTTDRRGGAEKIMQLDLDLRAWASDLNKHPHVSGLDLGDNTNRRKKDEHLNENTLIVPWLELLANITRILIHLPGLTFDRSTEQFQNSLQRCVLSAVTVVGLLRDQDLDRRVSILSPCGPSVIFQCGLLQLFYQCHTSAENQHLVLNHDASRDTLYYSVNLLEDLAPAYDKDPANEDLSPLLSLTGALVRLQSSLDRYQAPTYDFTTLSMDPGHTAAPELGPCVSNTQIDIWSATGLESLNQSGDFDSIFDFIPKVY